MADPGLAIRSDPFPPNASERISVYGVEAFTYEAGVGAWWHYCDACGGWIEGWADMRRVDKIDQPEGRDGWAKDCARCGKELGFCGFILWEDI